MEVTTSEKMRSIVVACMVQVEVEQEETLWELEEIDSGVVHAG